MVELWVCSIRRCCNISHSGTRTSWFSDCFFGWRGRVSNPRRILMFFSWSDFLIQSIDLSVKNVKNWGRPWPQMKMAMRWPQLHLGFFQAAKTKLWTSSGDFHDVIVNHLLIHTNTNPYYYAYCFSNRIQTVWPKIPPSQIWATGQGGRVCHILQLEGGPFLEAGNLTTLYCNIMYIYIYIWFMIFFTILYVFFQHPKVYEQIFVPNFLGIKRDYAKPDLVHQCTTQRPLNIGTFYSMFQ